MHGHGGIVLEHLKALCLHQDLGAGDVFFWYTTTGWMMWNYLAGGLLAGAAIVLYDGSAAYPGTDALWRLAAETGRHLLRHRRPVPAGLRQGRPVSPARELTCPRCAASARPARRCRPKGFRWVYEQVGSRTCMLGSFSGGTDLCTGFVGPSPLLPVRAGIIAGPCLGAQVEAYDAAGKPVIGEVGELVITAPMPSMPVGFWNDPGGERYRASYFADYPGVWRHGDWIMILPDGGCVIYGRSDATLNRGGVRMGTSEFYRVVERLPEIADSLVVDTGQLGHGRAADPVRGARRRPRARRRADRPAQGRAAGRAVAPARAGRDPPGAGHPAHAVRQEAGGPGPARSCWAPRWRRPPTRTRWPTRRCSRCSRRSAAA